MTTENDGSFAPSVKVLIFIVVGRIIWNFFRELIDAMAFCLFFRVNSSWLQKYYTTENDGSFAPRVLVLIFLEVGRIIFNFLN